MYFDPTQHAGRQSWVNCVISPRPIAWISTLNPDGSANLAPFSHFNAIASNPGMLMVSCERRPDGRKKDTVINAERTGEFVADWLRGGRTSG